MPNVGSRIRILRRQRRLPLERLATLASMSQQNWLRIEREESKVSFSTLQSMAEAMDVPITEFLKEEEIPQPKHFRDRVVYYRFNQKRQLKDLCAEAGITPQSWNRIERGVQNPKAETVAAMAHALGVRVETLLGEDHEKN